MTRMERLHLPFKLLTLHEIVSKYQRIRQHFRQDGKDLASNCRLPDLFDHCYGKEGDVILQFPLSSLHINISVYYR